MQEEIVNKIKMKSNFIPGLYCQFDVNRCQYVNFKPTKYCQTSL